MIIGYIRIPFGEQSDERQRQAVTAFNCDEIYSDTTAPRRDATYPERDTAVAKLGAGDKLVIQSLDKLAIEPVDILAVLDTLHRKKVTLISISEDLDTSKNTAFYYDAEIFNSMLKATFQERMVHIRTAGTLNGTPPGRPPKLSPQDKKLVVEWQSDRAARHGRKKTQQEIADYFGVNLMTIRRILEADKQSKMIADHNSKKSGAEGEE